MGGGDVIRQCIDGGLDPLRVEAGIGAGAWLNDDTVHDLTRIGRRLRCHGAFAADSAPMLRQHPFG